ncbi:hypothetical protein C367_00597 [Cryptococcus neoformans Ze90-1]|nr:hypothetical protein C367_00597 [Cryptococcus neoformans var. grubii Ze90-1]
MWRCTIARPSFITESRTAVTLDLSSSVGRHVSPTVQARRITLLYLSARPEYQPRYPSQSLSGTAAAAENATCRPRVTNYHDARVELTLNIAGRGHQTQLASPFQVPWCQSLTESPQCAMTSRRTPHRMAHPFPAPPSTQPVLFSHSTFTFIASWQGQLLVCTAVLFLGAIYFFVRRPVEDWRTRRRERLARAREKELMAMESNVDDKAASNHSTIEDRKEEVKMNAKERGRERRKEVKKNKGVLLKADSNISTSAESSPALPPTSFSVSSPDPPNRAHSSVALASLNGQGSSRRAESRTSSRALPPTPILVPSKSPSSNLGSQIAAGSKENGDVYGDAVASREPVSDKDSKQGEIGIVPDLLSKPVPRSKSDSSSSPRPSSRERVETAEPSSHHLEPTDSHEGKDSKVKSHGFSIFPEEGYLPIPVGHASGKKKKRKGKSNEKIGKDVNLVTPSVTGPTPHSLESEVESSPQPAFPQEIGSAVLALNYSPDSSEADITQPQPTARDALVESLRTELGVSKAEQAKAMDELIRARNNEERMKGEMEKVRRGTKETKKNDKDDLQQRYNNLSKMYAAALNRLSQIESFLLESGISLPPASPLPLQMPSSPAVSVPGSPYAASSGGQARAFSLGSGMYAGYPSPGLYPSPMLHNVHQSHPHVHPHAHSYLPNGSPAPFRRASSGMVPLSMSGTGNNPFFLNNSQIRRHCQAPGSRTATGAGLGLGEEISLAGPLTPGIGGFEMDMGIGIMPLGQASQTSVSALSHPPSKASGADNISAVSTGIIDEDLLSLSNTSSGADATGGGAASTGVTSAPVAPSPSLGKLSPEGKLAERRRLSVESTVLKRKVSPIPPPSAPGNARANGSSNGNDDVIVEEEDGSNVEEEKQVNSTEHAREHQNREEDEEKIEVGRESESDACPQPAPEPQAENTLSVQGQQVSTIDNQIDAGVKEEQEHSSPASNPFSLSSINSSSNSISNSTSASQFDTPVTDTDLLPRVSALTNERQPILDSSLHFERHINAESGGTIDPSGDLIPTGAVTDVSTATSSFSSQIQEDKHEVSIEPIFASLAHTPAQVEEMRRQREEASREHERREYEKHQKERLRLQSVAASHHMGTDIGSPMGSASPMLMGGMGAGTVSPIGGMSVTSPMGMMSPMASGHAMGLMNSPMIFQGHVQNHGLRQGTGNGERQGQMSPSTPVRSAQGRKSSQLQGQARMDREENWGEMGSVGG